MGGALIRKLLAFTQGEVLLELQPEVLSDDSIVGRGAALVSFTISFFLRGGVVRR